MSLKIIKAGLLDTVQDLGRVGYQHQGINPGGVMDPFSAALANALLGKVLAAPVIELHFPAAQIRFEKKAVICLAGADFTPMINGKDVPLHQPIAIKENTVLLFAKKRRGARCYLSLLNALEMKPWLNSYSTNLKAVVGGYKGRRLEKEDEISFADGSFRTEKEVVLLPWQYKATETNHNEVVCIPGPEWDWLTAASQACFLNTAFSLTRSSDRMGYRLQGEPLEQAEKAQLVSSAVTFGTVQLLPGGQLIVLMADHQTTGGYPRIATVISTQLPYLAQKAPGDDLRFEMTTTKAAEDSFVAQQKFLTGLQNTCKLKLQTWMHAH